MYVSGHLTVYYVQLTLVLYFLFYAGWEGTSWAEGHHRRPAGPAVQGDQKSCLTKRKI